MAYRYRRKVVKRLDQLIIGALPEKLKAQTEVPAATLRRAVPLSDKERARLNELSTRHMYGSLTPQEFWEREQLRQRKGAK